MFPKDSHEHDVAELLFCACGLREGDSLCFLEFATLVVVAASAHQGDVEAQVLWCEIPPPPSFFAENGCLSSVGIAPTAIFGVSVFWSSFTRVPLRAFLFAG
jgi:hypothetical protein